MKPKFVIFNLDGLVRVVSLGNYYTTAALSYSRHQAKAALKKIGNETK